MYFNTLVHWNNRTSARLGERIHYPIWSAIREIHYLSLTINETWNFKMIHFYIFMKADNMMFWTFHIVSIKRWKSNTVCKSIFHNLQSISWTKLPIGNMNNGVPTEDHVKRVRRKIEFRNVGHHKSDLRQSMQKMIYFYIRLLTTQIWILYSKKQLRLWIKRDSLWHCSK